MDGGTESTRPSPRIVGRYALYDPIASGGMATVHLGRLVATAGFSRPVAIKRLHPQFAHDPDFAAMFLDEARLAARVRHANVVQMVDVVSAQGEVFLVMEYVHGESFAYLLRAARAVGKRLPAQIVCNIVAGALHGLHAAHTATGEGDQPLCIVHRDVSPQNVLVGVDGVARVLDFGIAKAVGKLSVTREGQIKGKLRYVAPEQIAGAPVSPSTDIWAASVMLWEALTNQPLFAGDSDAALLHDVLRAEIRSPREIVPELPEALAEVVLAGLERDAEVRLGSALEMAVLLETAVGLVPAREVGEWVQAAAGARLAKRERDMAELEALDAEATVAPVHTSLGPTTAGRDRHRGSSTSSLAAIALALGVAATLWLSTRPRSTDVADATSSAQESSSALDSGALPREPIPSKPTASENPSAQPSAEPTAAPPPTAAPSTTAEALPPATGAPRRGDPPKSGRRAPPSKQHPHPYKVPLYGRD